MIVATVLLNLPNKQERFLKDWNAGGSSLGENLLYEEISFDELADIIAEENNVYVLYATAADTTSVAVFDKVYSLALNDYEVEKVYLIDSEALVGADRETDTELDTELKGYETTFGFTLDETTDLFYFKDGKLAAEANRDKITDKGSDWTSEIIRIFNNSVEK